MRLGTTMGLGALVLFAAGAIAAQEAPSQGWGDALRSMKECVMSMMGGKATGGSMMGEARERDRCAMGGETMGGGMMSGAMMGGGKVSGAMMGGGKLGGEMMGGGAGAERPNDQWRQNASGAPVHDPATHGSR